MSFTSEATDDNIPIAIETTKRAIGGEKIYYIEEEENKVEEKVHKQFSNQEYICSTCEHRFKSLNGYKYHISKVCKITKKYEIKIKNEITPLPTLKRQIIYIPASQDSGKTYRVGMFIKYWLKMFPDRRVIFISKLEKDDTITEVLGKKNEKKIERLIPDISFLENKFKLDEFQDSLMVFDDIISSNWSDNEDIKESEKENKMIQQYLISWANDVSQNGRHFNIHIILTSHAIYDGQKTSKILNDLTDICIFPRTTGPHHLNYLLTQYLGLDKKQITFITALNSRWIWIHKNDPRYLIYDHGIYRYNLI
jgi:hypothetical protein